MAASGQIEGDVRRLEIPADQLSDESREIRGWLALLAEKDNLLAYIAARRLANEVLDGPLLQSNRWRPPLRIHFRPMRGLYRLRQVRDGSVLALPTPMMAFDRAGLQALADLLFHQGRHAKETLHEQMVAEPYQNLQAEIASLSGVVERAAGAFHDLNTSFERVNAQYFQGQMPKPRLTWSRVLTGRKFGHHDALRDTVLISSTLDRADVPAFVVDFIMYHELLHKYFGLKWVAGRRDAHTAEFYAAEKRFAQHAEAEKWLGRLARER